MLIWTEISALPLGKRLAQEVYDLDGNLLINKGTVLEEFHLRNLIQRGHEYVYIQKNGADLIISTVPDDESDREERLAEAFTASVENMRQMMAKASLGHMITPDEVEECFNLVYDEVLNTANVIKQLQYLRSKDEYTLQHSIAVGVMSIKIGQTIKMDDDDLRSLGIAGLMHDIGKAKISPNIINKPAALNEVEFREIQKHPIYGYQIVNEMKFKNNNIALAVLHHHELQDGSGYPRGLQGDRINHFARIISVADVFDALTSDRVYRPRMPLLQAAEIIIKDCCGRLDTFSSRLLLSYIMDITIGEKVILSSGEEATIILRNEVHPTRPLVKVGERFLDLNRKHDVYIKEFVS